MKLPFKPHAVVLDLDGTIADLKGRSPHRVEDLEKDDVYRALVIMIDGLEYSMTNVLRRIILTGRYENTRARTEEWLRDHHINPHELIMRDVDADPNLIGMPNDLFKAKMYRELIQPNYEVVLAIEDRPKTAEMWHGLGIDVMLFIPSTSVIATA